MVGGRATAGVTWLPKLYAGLSVEFDRVNEYRKKVLAAAVPNDNLPAEALDDLEGKYGIDNYLGFSTQERINRIIERATGDGKGGPDYLQEQVQQAGFPLYVRANGNTPTMQLQYGGDLEFMDRGDCESVTPPMVTGETVPALSGATFARDVAQAHGGASSYKFTKTVAAGTEGYVALTDGAASTVDMHGFVAGQNVTFSVWVYIPSASGILGSEVILRIFDYEGAWTWTSQAAQNLYDQWQLVTVVRTIGAAATGLIIRIYTAATPDLNEYFNVDDISLKIWGASAPQYSTIIQHGQSLSRINPAEVPGELICSSPYANAGRQYLHQWGNFQYSPTILYGTPDPAYSYPRPKPFTITGVPAYWGRFFFLSPFADRLAANTGELLELTADEFRYFRKLVIQTKYLRDRCIAQVKVT